VTTHELKTTIESTGQRYLDEPVHMEISLAKPVALAVNMAYAKVPRGPRIQAVIRGISHYNRVPLRWMKPDGKGGLVPKYARDRG
jgi:hypothetical protein